MDGWESGVIRIHDSLKLYSGLTEEELKASSFYRENSTEVQKLTTGYTWYKFKSDASADGKAFYLALCFHQSRLVQASLALDGEEFPSSWDDWTEAGEMKRKLAHDEWLREQIAAAPQINRSKPYPYMEYRLPWGSIYSSYDPRSASASIGITFT
ncbi:hypothetical protein [Paenibacillus illinoisensis]|uniref:hypothetical protein n=1 Tax=Paenibacillus illinoisensis TaxID=59845 RepID=UPI00203FE460|nr:hypothetical protein [Paenibacillus illinoisensis]MCM3206172.1 hypothetical protein [Paenibacillus illinoisensis]